MYRSIRQAVACVLCATLLAACGGGGGDDISVPASGNSASGAPSSIIGKTVVQTVTRNDGSAAVIGVGKQIHYSFVDANTILGEGLHTLPTTSWSYHLNGNVATVDLEYSVGWAHDTWTFTSPTGGTYHSDTGLITGTKGWHEGTFVVVDGTGTQSGTGDTGGTGGTGGTTGGGGSTGQVAVWTSRSSGPNIDVSIDGVAVGTLTQYFTGTPNCGDAGTITRTLPVGSHTVKGTAGTLTWGPSSFNITAGGCLMYQLQ